MADKIKSQIEEQLAYWREAAKKYDNDNYRNLVYRLEQELADHVNKIGRKSND